MRQVSQAKTAPHPPPVHPFLLTPDHEVRGVFLGQAFGPPSKEHFQKYATENFGNQPWPPVLAMTWCMCPSTRNACPATPSWCGWCDGRASCRGLEQRFSQWFNARNDQAGTLWEGHFKGGNILCVPSLVALSGAGTGRTGAFSELASAREPPRNAVSVTYAKRECLSVSVP